MKIAFLGLGNMGSGMARNILDAGFELVVWNRTSSKTKVLADHGAATAKSIAEAVSSADVIVSSLMDDKSILENIEGEGGLLEHMKPGSTHVCVTTISPGLADQLLDMHLAVGTGYVSCPVLGRPDAAANGSLIALVAGPETALESVKPVIEAFTNMIIPLGTVPSHAATMKLCLNYTIISNIELMGEVYACCEKAGLSLEQVEGFFRVIYGFPVLHMYAEKLRKREFDDAGFGMAGGLKDVQLMLDAARNLGTRFDIGEMVENKMVEAVASGHQDRDWSAIYEVTRSRAKLD